MSVSLAKHVPSTIATVPTVVHVASGSTMPVVNEVLANNHLESFVHVLRGMNKGIYAIERRVSLKKSRHHGFYDPTPVVFNDEGYNHPATMALRDNCLETLQYVFAGLKRGTHTIY